MYNYQDHLFFIAINEIGYPTAKAIYNKYTEPYTHTDNNKLYDENNPRNIAIKNPAQKNRYNYFYGLTPKAPDDTMRANKIIGKLHDRVRFGQLGGDKISPQDKQDFDKINYNAQTQVRDTTLRQIASHPNGLVQGAKQINKEIIVPRLSRHLENVPEDQQGMMLAKGADSPYHLHHIGINKEQYPNEVLAKADALERATNFRKNLYYNYKPEGDEGKNPARKLFWMNRNARQVLNNQIYHDDYARDQNSSEKIKRERFHDYQYLPDSPNWRNWTRTPGYYDYGVQYQKPPYDEHLLGMDTHGSFIDKRKETIKKY